MNLVLATGIYPPEIGGPATFTRALAAAFQSKSIGTAIVTYGDGATQRAPAPVRVIFRGTSVLRRYFLYMREVYHAAREADLVFAQGPVSEGIPAMIGAAFARKPFVLKVVGDFAWEAAQRQGNTQSLEAFLAHPEASWKTRVLILLERIVARQAVCVITPSRYLESVVQRWGVSDSRRVIIYNAVHEETPEVASEVLRAQYGLEGKRILLAGGRLVPWKRIDLLLEMMASRPTYEVLVVAGDGPRLADWQRMAQERGLNERVHWLGQCSATRMASWYRAADLFLLPSLYEGLPHMVLEAALHGCPSLVSRWGGNPEAVDLCPGLVRVVESDDPSAWTKAVEEAVRPRDASSAKRWTQAEQMQEYRRVLEGIIKK